MPDILITSDHCAIRVTSRRCTCSGGPTPGSTEVTDYGLLPATYTADLPGRAAPVPMRVMDPRVFGVWGQGFGSFERRCFVGSAR